MQFFFGGREGGGGAGKGGKQGIYFIGSVEMENDMFPCLIHFQGQ